MWKKARSPGLLLLAAVLLAGCQDGNVTAPGAGGPTGTGVSRGGRLILLADHDEFATNLPEALGLGFAGSVAGTVTSFEPHAITSGVTTHPYLVGSTVTTAPPTATMLASLHGSPVMGIMSRELGDMFFLGETDGIQTVPQPLVDNLSSFMLTGARLIPACMEATVGRSAAEADVRWAR